MCTSHLPSKISRRGFAAMTAGAGIGLIPLRTWAAGAADSLCIMCIDYRFIDYSVSFFDSRPGAGKYDLTVLAGASLAGVLTKFPEAVPGFWKQIELARQLHQIGRVIVLDHMDCGAYAQQFNNGQPMQPDVERQAHIATMTQVKQAFYNRFPPDLLLEFFLVKVENDKPTGIEPIVIHTG